MPVGRTRMCEPLGSIDNSGNHIPERNQRRLDTKTNDYSQINVIHTISTADVRSIKSGTKSSKARDSLGPCWARVYAFTTEVLEMINVTAPDGPAT